MDTYKNNLNQRHCTATVIPVACRAAFASLVNAAFVGEGFELRFLSIGEIRMFKGSLGLRV